MAGLDRKRGFPRQSVVEKMHSMVFRVFATHTGGIKGQGDVAPRIAIAWA